MKITKHSMPMVDTGIGRDAGYESDAAMMEAVVAARGALAPEVREALERAERQIALDLIGGRQQVSGEHFANYVAGQPIGDEA